jgi:short-subunit dehydrogenase
MNRKKIIIVGASSGIGKELAKIYAAKNHLVAVTGRRCGLLEELKSLYPDNIITSCFNVMDSENQKHIEKLVQQLNGLDLLIYNAGYGDVSLQLQYESENITTRTNVNGFVEIVSFAFNYFVQQGQGQIAVTSSVAALRGNSWTPAYSASKAFMSVYAEGLNMKAGKLKKNILVTDIRPGFIDTKMAKTNRRFWAATPLKAALQIVEAIEKKKRVVYITKRWWLIAQLLKILPFSIYRRIV